MIRVRTIAKSCHSVESSPGPSFPPPPVITMKIGNFHIHTWPRQGHPQFPRRACPRLDRGRESTNSTLGALQSPGIHCESKNFAIVLIRVTVQTGGRGLAKSHIGHLHDDSQTMSLSRNQPFPRRACPRLDRGRESRNANDSDRCWLQRFLDSGSKPAPYWIRGPE